MRFACSPCRARTSQQNEGRGRNPLAPLQNTRAKDRHGTAEEQCFVPVRQSHAYRRKQYPGDRTPTLSGIPQAIGVKQSPWSRNTDRKYPDHPGGVTVDPRRLGPTVTPPSNRRESRTKEKRYCSIMPLRCPFRWRLLEPTIRKYPDRRDVMYRTAERSYSGTQHHAGRANNPARSDAGPARTCPGTTPRLKENTIWKYPNRSEAGPGGLARHHSDKNTIRPE